MRLVYLCFAAVLAAVGCSADDSARIADDVQDQDQDMGPRLASMGDVSDDFNRADSLVVGSTAQGHAWIESGDDDEHARILGGQLSVHYFDPVSIGAVHVNVADYRARDVNLRVQMKGHSTPYMSGGSFFGPAWRMADESGTWSSDGYHLRIEATGLSIAAGSQVLAQCQASMPIDADWHAYEVESVGRRHRVRIDDVEVIDCFDDTYLDEGYVGLHSFYSIFLADDFDVDGIESPARTYPQFAEYSPSDSQASVAVGDDFHRDESNSLGSYGGITWIEQGDADEHISIVNIDNEYRLRQHYFAGGTTAPNSWAVMDGLQLRDVEIRGRARGYDEHYMTGRPFGFSYRLQGAAVDHDDPGYHVLIEASGVRLMAGATEIAAWENAVDDQWHEYRVEAVGDLHRVFMDSSLIIEVADSTYPDAGRVGVAGYYSISYFDEVSARALPVVAVGQPFSDDFERTDSILLGTTVEDVPWIEEGDSDEHVMIDGGRLRLHYFAGGVVHPRSWAVMDGPELQNVELRARARGHSEAYMSHRLFGLSYRLQGASAEHDDPGYHLLIQASGIRLMAGAVKIGSWVGPVDAQWHDYRVEAVGDRHRVYMDDTLIMDVEDATYPDAGRVGVTGYYTISYFDHLSARALPVAGVDPYTLDMTQFYWSVPPTSTAITDVQASGVNAGHSYLSETQKEDAATASAAVEDYVYKMARFTMATLATLGGQFEADVTSPPSVEQDVADALTALDAYGNVSFWYLPEELRFWEPNERQEGLNLRDWAETYDPERRPVLMYSPNHGRSARIQREFEWAHVLVGGAYVYLEPGLSRAWARWRVQELLAGVYGGVHLGTDHEQGGRTPMIAGRCANVPGLDADEAYNFVFSALAEGARGIGVWSYFYGNEPGSTCLPGYAAAFNVLRDTTHPLGRALLHGSRDRSLEVVVTAGQAETEPFIPTYTAPQRLPSVAATLVLYEGRRYIIAANSRDDAVTVEFNHAGRAGDVEVLGESRTVPMVDGMFSDTFAARAVHLYAVPSGAL